MPDCIQSSDGVTCSVCGWVWKHPEVIPWPKRNCGTVKKPTPPREIILAYLADGPKETTEIIRDLSNSPNGGKGSICTKTLNATLLELKVEGVILLSEDCLRYSIS